MVTRGHILITEEGVKTFPLEDLSKARKAFDQIKSKDENVILIENFKPTKAWYSEKKIKAAIAERKAIEEKQKQESKNKGSDEDSSTPDTPEKEQGDPKAKPSKKK